MQVVVCRKAKKEKKEKNYVGTETLRTSIKEKETHGSKRLQFYWFRATVKFFNCMLDSNSETL